MTPALSPAALFARMWRGDFPPLPLALYAIVDGARSPSLVRLIARSTLAHACLYDGPLSRARRESAPHLVALHPHAPAAHALLERGWGRSALVGLLAGPDLAHTRRHLRRFLRVRDGLGRRLLFRFYDPRVLRVYLPTCRADELTLLFGPIHSFFVEDEEGGCDELAFDGSRLCGRAPLTAARGERPITSARLVIRDEQMDVLARATGHQFVVRLARAVERRHPEWAARPRDALYAEVETQLRRARAWGLTWSSSIADFVGLAFDVGARFDEHPVVRRLLGDESQPPDLRLRRLFDELTPDVWGGIRFFARGSRP